MLPNSTIEAWLQDIKEASDPDPREGNCAPENTSPLPACASIHLLRSSEHSTSRLSIGKKCTSPPQPSWKFKRQRRGLVPIDVNMAQQMNPRRSPRKKKLSREFTSLDENTPIAAAAEKEEEQEKQGQENEQQEATPRPMSRSGDSGKSRAAARSDGSLRWREAGWQDLTGFDDTIDNIPVSGLGIIPELRALQLSSGYSIELKSVSVGSSAGRRQSQAQSSTASSAAASGRSKRSTSPVKSISDLELAVKPIEFQSISKELPPDVSDLYQQLKDISDGIGIIPAAVKDKVAAVGGGSEPVRPWATSNVSAVDDAGAEQEFMEILEILGAAIFCNDESVSEAAWNEEVHSRILRLALKNVPGVRHYNITTARICPELVPKHGSGDTFSSKLVDYSINILPSDIMRDSIRKLLHTQPYGLQTINQTKYGPVRFKPCAFSIETKAQGSEDGGKVQLAMWSVAYFARIRSFQQNMDDILSVSTAKKNETFSTITLPQILATTHHWDLYFVRDCEDRTKMIGKLNIGDSGSLHGIYKLLSALRCLAKWSTGTFREWVEKEVLGIDLSV